MLIVFPEPPTAGRLWCAVLGCATSNYALFTPIGVYRHNLYSALRLCVRNKVPLVCVNKPPRN